MKMLKFRLRKGKGSVQGFTDVHGITHLPGDIVELPAAYDGERWLEKVKDETPEAPPMQEVRAEQAPLGKQKKPRS